MFYASIGPVNHVCTPFIVFIVTDHLEFYVMCYNFSLRMNFYFLFYQGELFLFYNVHKI